MPASRHSDSTTDSRRVRLCSRLPCGSYIAGSPTAVVCSRELVCCGNGGTLRAGPLFSQLFRRISTPDFAAVRLGLYRVCWRRYSLNPFFFCREYTNEINPVTPEGISILKSIRKPGNVVLNSPLKLYVSVPSGMGKRSIPISSLIFFLHKEIWRAEYPNTI